MSKNYQHIRVVLIISALVLLVIFGPVRVSGSNLFCSAICKPNQCTDKTATSCKQCDADFTLSGSTCIVDSGSQYAMIDNSSDLGGNLVANTAASGSCGIYSFIGRFSSSQTVMVSSMDGINTPFFSIELIYWVILIDDWSTGAIVSTTFNQLNSQENSSYNSVKKTSEKVCDDPNKKQRYLKVNQTWDYNQTGVRLDFQVKMLNTSGSNWWGIKQFQLLAKLCNFYCASCWSRSITNCWQCVNEMKINNNTCNQSCLTGFGPTSNQDVCVWCNLRCAACYQTMDNCSSCTPSGQWLSFLIVGAFQCVGACPDGYYGNISSLTCDHCDPICLTCGISSTHCYDCFPGFGWNSYYCYNPCPIGTYTDLTNPVYNGSINCTSCSKYCIECSDQSTNCTSCTLNGANQAYLLDYTCYTICPVGYYKENYNYTGPNQCLPCNMSCATCTGDPSPCQSCNPTFYLYQSVCGTTCPEPAYFPNNATWTCLECNIYCVGLTINMYFSNSKNLEMYIDMSFTQVLNFSAFSMETFQTITTDSSLITLDKFNIEYIQTSSRSYRIILIPKGYIFIYNVTFIVTTMSEPTPIDQSVNYYPFKSTNYDKSASLKWFLIKSPAMSLFEESIINGLSIINDKMSKATTLPYVQQIKKTGVFSLLLGGAQITSCSILVNTIPSQNMYEGVRFWAMFVFFDVPNWEKNSNKTKYVVAPPQDQLIQNARLLSVEVKQRMLFNTSQVDWRFQRTGHTSFFIFDCYMSIFMIIFCWIFLLIGHCIIKKKKLSYQHMGKFYTILHKVHQITILYISLATLLEWIYFDATSLQRWISFGSCILANLYFLIYELYIYHDMLKYPLAQIGTQLYEYYIIKYGSFLKNIRHEEFDIQQNWSPKLWFRPYNYHFISYYKKLMMMVSLPLFYNANNYQIYVLILIQILEILRFYFTWPFKSKSRNILRLCLQFVLLLFFFTIAASHYLIEHAVQLDSITQAGELQTYINVFYKVGWTSFILVFLFNFGFFFIFVYDICLGFRKSNRQLMDQTRRNFYMNKLESYESYELENQHISLGTVNKWVKLGNLNQRNFKQLSKIKIRIEYFKITKLQKGGYWISMKKLLDLSMNLEFNYRKEKNVTVKEKINKSFLLKRSLSAQFYQKINSLYQSYTQKDQFQCMTIKTFFDVQQSNYKPGDKIQITMDKISQKIELHTYTNETKVIQLDEVMPGFPVQKKLIYYL